MSALAQIIVVSILAPSVLAGVTYFFTSRTKKQDWARQDEVAARAAQVANELLASNKEIAAKAEEDHKATNAKLEVIRVDVNSNMTASMRAELDATEGQLVLMREVARLQKAAGAAPTQESLALIRAKEDRIAELRAQLADRLTSTGDEADAAETE